MPRSRLVGTRLLLVTRDPRERRAPMFPYSRPPETTHDKEACRLRNNGHPYTAKWKLCLATAGARRDRGRFGSFQVPNRDRELPKVVRPKRRIRPDGRARIHLDSMSNPCPRWDAVPVQVVAAATPDGVLPPEALTEDGCASPQEVFCVQDPSWISLLLQARMGRLHSRFCTTALGPRRTSPLSGEIIRKLPFRSRPLSRRCCFIPGTSAAWRR